MIVVDESLLDCYRGWNLCEYCGKWEITEPHHLKPKGMGGGSRLDLPFNLARVSRRCHSEIEAKKEAKQRIKAIVALRERMTEDEMDNLVWLILRLPKGSELPSLGKARTVRRKA